LHGFEGRETGGLGDWGDGGDGGDGDDGVGVQGLNPKACAQRLEPKDLKAFWEIFSLKSNVHIGQSLP